MNGLDLRFHRAMSAALDAEIAREAEAVIGGKLADHAEYRNRCGRIAALRKAKDLAEEARAALLRDDEGED